MDDDIKADVEIYQYFSECLKIFRKKMALVCKISNLDTQQINPHLQSHFNQVNSQGANLLKKFETNLSDITKIQPIFSRFLLRIKQSVHSFVIKTSDIDIVNFLKFIEHLIKQYNNTLDMKTLLKTVLIKVPKSTQTILFSDGNMLNKSQNLVSMDNKEIKNPFTAKNNQSHFDSYDKYLQALDRQYRLFDCLNIEQSHYRRSFFLALQDIHRKDSNLYQEMLSRNRYAKQSLQYYQKQFEANKKKLKQKLLKTHTQISLGEIKPKKINTNVVIVYKQQVNDTSNEKHHASAPKRVKTVYSTTSKKQESISSKQIPILLNSFNHLQTLKAKNNFRDTLQGFPQVNHYSSKKQQMFMKTRINQSEKHNFYKNMNIIPLKKVQFRGARIQLAPQEIQKKSVITVKQQERRKKLNNRAQQHFRKKISFITQPKVQKQFTLKTQMSPQKQKQKNYNSIRINFCRYDY